jgi:hypothetical protein
MDATWAGDDSTLIEQFLSPDGCDFADVAHL